MEVSRENWSLWRPKQVMETKNFLRGNSFGVIKYKDRSATSRTKSSMYERNGCSGCIGVCLTWFYLLFLNTCSLSRNTWVWKRATIFLFMTYCESRAFLRPDKMLLPGVTRLVSLHSGVTQYRGWWIRGVTINPTRVPKHSSSNSTSWLLIMGGGLTKTCAMSQLSLTFILRNILP